MCKHDFSPFGFDFCELNSSLSTKQDTLSLIPLSSSNGTYENGGYIKIGSLVIFDVTFTCSAVTVGQALLSGFPATTQNDKPFYAQQMTGSPANDLKSMRIYGNSLYPNTSLGAGRYHCYGMYISAN